MDPCFYPHAKMVSAQKNTLGGDKHDDYLSLTDVGNAVGILFDCWIHLSNSFHNVVYKVYPLVGTYYVDHGNFCSEKADESPQIFFDTFDHHFSNHYDAFFDSLDYVTWDAYDRIDCWILCDVIVEV